MSGASIFCSDVPGRVFGNYYVNEYVPIEYNQTDRAVLRELAYRFMEVANDPHQMINKNNWKQLNDLKMCRPLVWHNEVCWHEMNVEDELTLNTSTVFTQHIESEFRRQLYLWKHMPGDMVVEPVIYSPAIVENSGIGVEVHEDTAVTDVNNAIVSHHFIPEIQSNEDINRIVAPKVAFMKKESDDTKQAYEDVLGGVIPIQMRGFPGFWFAPWDDIVTLMGVEKALINLYDEPEMMYRLVGRLIDVYIEALAQYENLGVIATNNSNFRIGSGAYGYSDELPVGNTLNMKCADIWGAAAAQILTSASPQMHNEFAIAYEKKWLERFRFSYYGCCEALDKKIDILRNIKNLRKISISPWADCSNAANQIGRDYVISLKPSPAVLADVSFDINYAHDMLKKSLDSTKGCNVEIIMKDISTVRYQPQRLWNWVKMASELVLEY